jgi:hypothetical protein
MIATFRPTKYSQQLPNMNYLKTSFLLLLALAMSSPVYAQSLTRIPVPLVPSRGIGDYHTQLEKMRLCLLENRKSDFYKEAERLSVIIEANRIIRRVEKRPIETREDFIAIEWRRYYATMAPFITEKDIANGMFRKKNLRWHFKSPDLDSKFSVFDSMRRISKKEYEEMAKILGKDIKKIKEIHINYMTILIKSMRTAKNDTDNAREEFGEKMRSEAITMDRRDIMFRELAQMGTRSTCAKVHLENMYRHFVWQLVDTFPKNGEIVQKYLFSTGCSKEECRLFLEWEVGRKKETEHLFKGLPPSPPESRPSTSKK